RFVVLTKDKNIIKINHPVKMEKTTLLITLPSDYAGALHQVISPFPCRKLTLSKIESRPTKTGMRNYFFIIDVNQSLDVVLFASVQAELEALGCSVTLLGSYPVFQMHL